MKRLFCLILSLSFLTLLLIGFFGCGVQNDIAKIKFTNKAEMESYMTGSWKVNNSDHIIYYISNGKWIAYDDDAFNDKVSSLFLGDTALPLEEQENSSPHEFFMKEYTHYALDFDYSTSTVFMDNEEFLLVIDDNAIKVLSDFENLKRGDILLKTGNDTFPTDTMIESFNIAKNIHVFSNKAKGFPSNVDVQYDKYSYLGENFFLYGKAELDDYYNGNYKNMESYYFCIRITPSNGDYWFVYAPREEFPELFEKLKKGETYLSTICRLETVNAGLSNMATLVDCEK